jgi:hypothetical protein
MFADRLVFSMVVALIGHKNAQEGKNSCAGDAADLALLRACGDQQ